MIVAFRKRYLVIAVLVFSLVVGGYSGASKYLKEKADTKKQAEIVAQLKPIFGNLPEPKLSYVNDSKNSTKTVTVAENTNAITENPETAKVYQYDKNKNLSLEGATHIATVLGINSASILQEDESYIFYGDDKKSALTFWPSYNQINYYRRDGDFSGDIPSLEGATNIATYYLSQFNLAGFNLVPDKSLAKYEIRKDKEYPEAGNMQTYDSVFVPFIRSGLDFKPTSLPYQENLLYLAVGPNNKVLNMALYYAPLSDVQSGVYQIKTYEKARSEAILGNGQVVKLEMPESFYFNADAVQPVITAVSISNWYLAYLDRQDLEFLQPVYVFTGVAFLAQGSSAPVTMYVNAM